MEAMVVNRLLIERVLADISANTHALRTAGDITWEVYRTDLRARRFVERTLHILVEACIDIAHHIISDCSFREPSSYRDAFAVLAENGVIDQEDLRVLEQMAAFRNLIVHYYERVDDAVVFGLFKNRLKDFDRFARAITAYLKRSSGEPNQSFSAQ